MRCVATGVTVAGTFIGSQRSHVFPIQHNPSFQILQFQDEAFIPRSARLGGLEFRKTGTAKGDVPLHRDTYIGGTS